MSNLASKNLAKNATMNAVVFSGRSGLEFHELRCAVMRIPEVSLRVREAQGILDEMELLKVDLFNFITGDDSTFFRNIKLKALASAIVQVGLYERMLKTQRKPDFLVGESGGDSALMVCAGLLSFRELIMNSPALEALKPTEKILTLVTTEVAPLLTGISLTEYLAMRLMVDGDGPAGYETVREGLMDLKRVVASLIDDEGVARFINIGPASVLRSADYKALGSDEIESLDSIELDPMLGWFWGNLRQSFSARAQ